MKPAAVDTETTGDNAPGASRSTGIRRLDPGTTGGRLLLLGAVAAAAVLAAVVVANLVGLLLLRHPYVGFSDNILTDAEAVATGHLQYGNPASQYVGLPYSPLYVWLVAGLLRIFWWSGWGSFVSVVAAAAALVAVVRFVWRFERRPGARLASASFVVALVLGGLAALPIAGLPFSGLYESRPDELAWCLTTVAGTLVFRELLVPSGRSLRRQAGVGLVLAASVGTKQTTILPCLVLAVVAVAGDRLAEPGVRRTARQWARSSTVAVVFLGTLVIAGLVLQVASHGFASDVIVTAQLRYGRAVPIGQELETSLRLLVVPLAALAVLVAGTVWAGPAAAGGDRRRRVAAISAVVFALSPLPTAVAATAKLGGRANQLIGPVWTTGLACAVLLVLLRPSARRLAATGVAGAVLLVGVASFWRVDPGGVGVPDLHETVTWTSIDPYLLAVAQRGKPLYDETFPSLSVSPKNPGAPAEDINDTLASGYTPRLFIDNVLTGRYALVTPVTQWVAGYASDLGRYDGSVPWKIDILLSMGYQEVTDPTDGQVLYRPTAKLVHLGWFAGCFGPYQARAAGVDVRLRGSGGLACIAAGSLHLTRAPASKTQFVMTLARGRGHVELRFARATPSILEVTPLNGADHVTGPGSDVTGPQSAVTRCLVHQGSASTLTLEAVPRPTGVSCEPGPAPVLEVPSAGGATVAHLLVSVGAADSPRIVASTPAGRPAPFTLLDLTPGDVDSL